MCWFSAYEVLATRNAIEGEELEVQEFPEIGRRWLASPGDPKVAVCIPSGCSVRLTGIPQDLQNHLRVGTEAIAEFRENYRRPRPFLQRIAPPDYLHDVLVFEGGGHFPVRMLPLGIKLDVLSPTVASPTPRPPGARVSDPVAVLFP